MSDKQKAELTHSEDCYGCHIEYSFEGERAVLTDPDGKKHEFEEDRGMIAQGAPNALLLAKHHAKKDEKRRAEEKASKRAEERAAKVVAQGKAEQPPKPFATPKEPEGPVVVDSPVPGEPANKPNLPPSPPLPPARPSEPKRGNK